MFEPYFEVTYPPESNDGIFTCTIPWSGISCPAPPSPRKVSQTLQQLQITIESRSLKGSLQYNGSLIKMGTTTVSDELLEFHGSFYIFA